MESPPPLSRFIPQTPKKRVFPGSSSVFMDDEVVEIPPPANRSSNAMSQKQKEVIFPEIIDVDMDEECIDMMLVDKEVDKNGKGKEVISNFTWGSSSGINDGSGKALEPFEKNYASGSECFTDGDDLVADLFYAENEVLYEENAFMDLFNDDYLYDDQYDIVQSHLDDLDIPPGVEVPVPWFMSQQENERKPAVANISNLSASPIDLEVMGFPLSDSASPTLPSEWELPPGKSTTGGSRHVGAELKDVPHLKKWETSSSRMSDHLVRKKATASSSGKESLNSSSKKWEPSSSSRMYDYFIRKKATASSSGKESLNLSSHTRLIKSHHQLASSAAESDSASKFSKKFLRTKKHVSNGGTGTSDLYFHKRAKPNRVHSGAVINTVGLQDARMNTVGHSSPSAQFKSGLFDPSFAMPFFPMSPPSASEPSLGSFAGKEKYGVPADFLKKFELFKRFDIVEEFSDHHYAKNGSSMKQPPMSWVKKIQDEWRILENDLPDTIFVRIYESRMDLLRAVIIGAEGTPYHDGLFFFDVFFPSKYPSIPPEVYYHSHGHRINPNLYNTGKVCLSLLNTWSGSHREKWIPGQSTILQVLVSIQGLILNAKPYFNEPAYANLGGSPDGEKSSMQYNENTFILSLKTMVCCIRNPPKYFEEFVAGHFFKCARDILVACKAYVDGAQVGCLVKGGVQDVDEGDTSCSQHFKDNLAVYLKTLVDAFKVLGVVDCDEFRSLVAQKSNTPKKTAPQPSNRLSRLAESPHSNFYKYLM